MATERDAGPAMIEIPIEFIRPGDRLARNHSFRRLSPGMSATVDLARGYSLTKRVIAKLRNHFSVQSLWIEDPQFDESRDAIDHGFDDAARQKVISEFNECIAGIETDQKMDLRKMRLVVQNILDNVTTAIRHGNGSFRALSSTFCAVQSHDAYTWEHSVNSAIYAAVIALSIPGILDETQRPYSPVTFSKPEILVFNLLLHDVGKIRIPIQTLNKGEGLTDNEYTRVTRHPYEGFVYMRKINERLARSSLPAIPAYFMRGCLLHHQAYDGTGYPSVRNGDDELRPMAGDAIPIVGRIAAVADVYDALTSNRPYRRPYHPADALRIIIAERGMKLDPKIANILIRRVSPFPRGSTVVLNTGELAIVTGHTDTVGFYPTVQPFMRKVRQNGRERIIRLSNRDPLSITESSRTKIIINDALYHKVRPTYP